MKYIDIGKIDSILGNSLNYSSNSHLKWQNSTYLCICIYKYLQKWLHKKMRVPFTAFMYVMLLKTTQTNTSVSNKETIWLFYWKS